MKQVKYNDTAEKALEDIIKKRSETLELPLTRQAIVHKAIIQLHKRECKQWLNQYSNV